jgi:hypothetical protein
MTVKRIVVTLALPLLAGCGFDWFPASNTFQNSSTASPPLQNLSAAKSQVTPGNYSTAGRPASGLDAKPAQ